MENFDFKFGIWMDFNKFIVVDLFKICCDLFDLKIVDVMVVNCLCFFIFKIKF